MVDASTPKMISGNKAAIYCRIRPAAYDGSGHDQNGQAVAKSIKEWGENTITLDTQYMFSKGENKYKFPKKVFEPETTQQQVFDEVEPLVNEFISTPGRNAMLLAYGQTGTGKTHTIFGKKEAQLDADQEGEWGIFPKVVATTLRTMQSKGHKFKLYIAGLEFYLMSCYDLLDKNVPVTVDEATGPRLSTQVEIKSIDDLQEVLKTVLKNRTAASTKMNVGSKEHSGSSRSHASLILRLYQVDTESKFQKTEFHMIDLAGAERPDKLGVERVSAYDIMCKLMKGGKPGIADQGFMINYGLAELQTMFVTATEAHKKGKKFKVATALTPPDVQYISQLVNGSCIMNMIICLSQAPQNGWETWFSLQYGTNLSKLEIAIPKQKLVDHKVALKDSKSHKVEMDKKADPKAPVTKHTNTHKENAKVAAFKVQVLEELA